MIIIWERTLKSRLLGIVSVIVYHVHYNANAVLVKCHNKLFELSYPALRVIRVCGI